MNFGEAEAQTVEFSPGLPNHGAFFFRTYQHGVLEPVMRSREHRAALVPNDLLMVQEADAKQAIEHLARKFAGVPDVADLEVWDERERFRPIGASVTGDARARVPLGPALHIARLGGPMAVEPSAVPPFRIEFNSERGICDQQERPAVAQKPGDRFRAGCVRRRASDAGAAACRRATGHLDG